MGSGIPGISDNQDLYRAEPSHSRYDVEVFEDSRNLTFQVLLEIAIMDTSHGDWAHLWNVDLPGAIHD